MPYQSIYRAGLFAGQTIIVTGGGSGIGRCTAHELASLGAHVALVGRKLDKLESVRAEILEDGGSASCFVADIREEALVIQVIEDVLRERGRIDALVNNAGGQYRTAMKTITTKGFEAARQIKICRRCHWRVRSVSRTTLTWCRKLDGPSRPAQDAAAPLPAHGAYAAARIRFRMESASALLTR